MKTYLWRFDQAIAALRELAYAARCAERHDDAMYVDRQLRRIEAYRVQVVAGEARRVAARRGVGALGPSRTLQAAGSLIARAESRGGEKQGFQSGFPVSR